MYTLIRRSLSFLQPDPSNDALHLRGHSSNARMQGIDSELVGTVCGIKLYHGICMHLGTTSFRHIVDNLGTGYYNAVLQKGQSLEGDVLGVRVSCAGYVSIT
jgi:hypothetical protein